MNDAAHRPQGIHLHRKSRELELTYAGEQSYRLSCEYLRVYSPSAEVKGHGPGQEVLQTGKQQVTITAIKPVGHYALQLVFDDGHDTGLYSWDYLYQLCREQESWWQDYLTRMEAAGASRDPQVQVVKFQP
ncbi:1-(5-phosphoribosyl)-5-((5-phosphoribosylamino)methylideneamino)imidazole-4-carboxamide isomerase [Kineobactrum sediminis]|uniref:1-(5-phosphoribosyl)-5-((5-phosphoribosylamino)methylideneamino)imidazole-4-carboxamide isomerase n=1 Tax=Kineobactrum sediminis TaxID=1905677 RepID=A0A2N5Y781_9GAMM|nr:DUF971 domain-containing protein [Kineobactrum sediminis]PLW84244.1 1-(5-phosphoribosyl)-5-((5-phosphoribosylamino)methylideneamino)imidazole-4-carboxamide isomerase [Kineobactrum sediminis]